MIDRIVGNKLIPVNVRPDIIERSDGIPLFVEEMTKAVLEAEGESAAQCVAARRFPSPTLAVPASLHASLMARLDRLGSAKEVAQVGAAIGREFSHALLGCGGAAAQAGGGAEIGARPPSLRLVYFSGMASRLAHAGRICLSMPWCRTPPMARCCASRDSALHARIAEILERQFAEICRRDQPELVARHCTEAGLIEEGCCALGQGRTAVVEAIGACRGHRKQLTQAIDLIATVARHTNAAPTTHRASGRPSHKPTRFMSKGYATPEAKDSCGSRTSIDRRS